MEQITRYSLPEAVAAIKAAQDSRQTLSILKAIVGKAAAGDALVRAAVYREWIEPIDTGPCGYISTAPEADCLIPQDFWRANTATYLKDGDRYKNGTVSIARQTPVHSLPDRLRRHQTDGQRVLLSQSAEAITIDADDVWALAAERDWRPWLDYFYKAGRSGPDAIWKRDETLIMMAGLAARDPSILNDERRIFDALQECSNSLGAYPDTTDLHKMARALLAQAIDPSNENSPPD